METDKNQLKKYLEEKQVVTLEETEHDIKEINQEPLALKKLLRQLSDESLIYYNHLIVIWLKSLTKEKVKNYLKESFDITFDQILKDLRIEQTQIQEVKNWLEELEKEEWIKKSFCSEHQAEEFDPGKAQSLGN